MKKGGSHPPPSRSYIDRKDIQLWTNHFEDVGELGKGAYARVFKGKEKKTGALFALKRLEHGEKEDRYVSREIRAMKKLRGHQNIIQLLGLYMDSKGHMVLQMELCTGGNFALLLSAAMEGNGRSAFSCLGAAQVKGYISQLLQGMRHMMKHNIIHRDLKPENLLLQGRTLKIADFGLCKEQNPEWQKYSPNLQTLWYRAPEMCMGFDTYDAAVDMWSFGCIMGEFLFGTALLPGRGSDLKKGEDIKENAQKNGQTQLTTIYQLCGTPKVYDWPAAQQAVVRGTFKQEMPRILITAFMKSKDAHKRRSFITDEAIALLDAVLQLEPHKRLTPETALLHPYLTTEFPRPYNEPEMLRIPEARIPKVKKRIRE